MEIVMPLVLRFHGDALVPGRAAIRDGLVLEQRDASDFREVEESHYDSEQSGTHYLRFRAGEYLKAAKAPSSLDVDKLRHSELGALLYRRLVTTLALAGYRFFANPVGYLFCTLGETKLWTYTWHHETSVNLEGSSIGWDQMRFELYDRRVESHFQPWSEGGGRILVALSSFWSALGATREDQATIFLAIASEALLSTQDMEITHQLSERAAFLLSSDPDQRIEVYRRMKKFYGQRSSFVHGSNHSKESPTAAMSADEESPFGTVKRLLDLALAWPAYNQALRHKKEDLTRGFFNELVFGKIAPEQVTIESPQPPRSG